VLYGTLGKDVATQNSQQQAASIMSECERMIHNAERLGYNKVTVYIQKNKK